VTVALERAAREFAEATALPPYLFDLGPAASRAVIEEIQTRPVARPAAARVPMTGWPASSRWERGLPWCSRTTACRRR
jgi:hypothetical protein